MFGLLWRNALRRGLLGGNRTWMTVFAILGIAKVVRRLSGSEPEVVYCEPLRRGEGLVITHLADERLGDP